MPTSRLQRAVLCTSLALGAADVVWLDLVLAQDALGQSHEPDGRVEIAHLGAASTSPSAAPEPAVRSAVPLSDAPELTERSAASPARSPERERERVYFAHGSAELTEHARALATRIASDASAGMTVRLVGHADHRGTDGYNDQLSLRRAEAVAEALVELGVSRRRIRIEARGETDASDALDWRDRRVDVHLQGGLP